MGFYRYLTIFRAIFSKNQRNWQKIPRGGKQLNFEKKLDFDRKKPN
jgi:hypothetical protein